MSLYDGLVGPSGRPFLGKLIRNAARCTSCGDLIVSNYRHDFRACSCGAVVVDGGLDYVRVVFSGEYTDLSITQLDEMSNEEIQQYHEWGYL